MSTSEMKSTAKDWDEVRMGFNTSIMVDTSLASLAQDLDAPPWPLPGKDETPAKYVDLSFEELQLAPGLNGYPDRIDQLIYILRQTLVFDDPFGAMVAPDAAADDRDNPLLKNLAKLGISADFPIEHTMVSPGTKEFCALEEIVTLGQFAKFAQGLPPHVIVGGHFRSLLNALALVDEAALAEILPFRPGSKGLHLPEALGQLAAALPAGDRFALFKRLGGRLKPPEVAQAAKLEKDDLKRLETELQERATPLFKLFKDELNELRTSLKEGGSLERYLAVLQDPLRETLAAKMLEPIVGGIAAASAEAAEPQESKAGRRGFFARLFRK